MCSFNINTHFQVKLQNLYFKTTMELEEGENNLLIELNKIGGINLIPTSE